MPYWRAWRAHSRPVGADTSQSREEEGGNVQMHCRAAMPSPCHPYTIPIPSHPVAIVCGSIPSHRVRFHPIPSRAVASQGALPGNFKVGESLYYTGPTLTETLAFGGLSGGAPAGNKWVHGQRGEVVGPAMSEAAKGKGLSMRFHGNKDNVNCWLTELSRSPPVRRATLAAQRCSPPPLHAAACCLLVLPFCCQTVMPLPYTYDMIPMG